MNKEKFKSKFNLAVLIGVIVILSVLAYEGMNMQYTIERGYIKINWFTGVTIPIKDINEAVILDKTPRMTKMVGVELFNIRQGTFSLDGVGRVKMYAGDINKKLVLLKTDKITYALTPEDPSQFLRLIGKK